MLRIEPRHDGQAVVAGAHSPGRSPGGGEPAPRLVLMGGALMNPADAREFDRAAGEIEAIASDAVPVLA